MEDVSWGGGTSEAWKKTLADTPLTDGNSLVVSNEFNSFLNDLDKCSSSKGDKNMLCDMFDGMSIRRHTKIDGDMNIDKPNVAITGMTQPEHIIPWIRAGSDPSGFWNRLQIVAPFVKFKSYDEVESLDEETHYLFSKC